MYRGKNTLYVIGYPITKNLYNSFISTGSQPINIRPSVPAYILSISLMDEATNSIKKYVEFLEDGGSLVAFEHITAEPFWDRYWQWECSSAVEITLQWLPKFLQ